MLAAAADLLDQGQLLNRLSVAVTAIALAVLLLPDGSHLRRDGADGRGRRRRAALLSSSSPCGSASMRRSSGVSANDAAAERLDVAAFDAALLALN